MKAREIALLIFIVCAGLVLTQSYKGRLNWSWDWGDWDAPFFGSSHEFAAQESKVIDAPLPEELIVDNSHGDVDIQAAADGRLTVILEKKAYRRNEAEARTAAEELRLTAERRGGNLVLSTNRDEFKKKRFVTNFRITVPEGLAVDVRTSYGLVRVSQTGKTSIENSHGGVTASDIRGALTSRNTYEDVSVSDVASDCEVECHHGAATVVRVKGRVQVKDTYGQLRVEEAGGDVSLDGSHTEIVGLKLAGAVKAETTYRDISLTDVGSATVVGHHSGVEVNGCRGNLDITDTYGRVKVQNIQGGLAVHGQSLEVFGRALTGPENSVSTTYQNIDLAGFSGRTTVTTSHGNVTLQPAVLAGDLEVKADYAGIRLLWPAGARYPFEARTNNGDIRWNLSVPPDLDQKNGSSLLKAFGAEQGKPRVVLNTSYANIIVEEQGPSGTDKI